MAVDRSAQRPPKTLAEGAACLACTIGLLLAAAMIMQWVLHLVP
jgi:hypothetical protein